MLLIFRNPSYKIEKQCNLYNFRAQFCLSEGIKIRRSFVLRRERTKMERDQSLF